MNWGELESRGSWSELELELKRAGARWSELERARAILSKPKRAGPG